MNNIPNFEDLKNNLLQIAKYTSLSSEDELSIDFKSDLERLFDTDLTRLNDAVMLLKKAKEADDKVTTLAALVYIRVYSMQLSGFFEDIKDDADLLARSQIWPDLP